MQEVSSLQSVALPAELPRPLYIGGCCTIVNVDRPSRPLRLDRFPLPSFCKMSNLRTLVRKFLRPSAIANSPNVNGPSILPVVGAPYPAAPVPRSHEVRARSYWHPAPSWQGARAGLSTVPRRASPSRESPIRPSPSPPGKAAAAQTRSQPKATPPHAFTVETAGFDLQASISLDKQSQPTVRIYTDGSAHPDRAGAAAVLLREGRDPRVLRLPLLANPRFTAREAEAVALLLGLHLLATERENLVPCSMSTDCQELIKTIQATFPSSGLHVKRLPVLGEFYKQANFLASMNRHGPYSLQLRWVKGHSGVRGNVIANREARIAAIWGLSSPSDLLPPILRQNSILWTYRASPVE
ncbi:hypothetical protein BJV78DRAFT_844502 [Lactifluus subvellereus]|nr:hypothetical protein BJV78DRAFT_844502 [Lactifluus subvellereus]